MIHSLRSYVDTMQGYGTSEGVSKAWDTRGRGRKSDTSRNAILKEHRGVRSDFEDARARILGHPEDLEEPVPQNIRGHIAAAKTHLGHAANAIRRDDFKNAQSHHEAARNHINKAFAKFGKWYEGDDEREREPGR